jgi:hypothetical protein
VVDDFPLKNSSGLLLNRDQTKDLSRGWRPRTQFRRNHISAGRKLHEARSQSDVKEASRSLNQPTDVGPSLRDMILRCQFLDYSKTSLVRYGVITIIAINIVGSVKHGIFL